MSTPTDTVRAYRVPYRVIGNGECVVWASNAVEAELRVRRGDFYRDRRNELLEHVELDGSAELEPESATGSER